MKTMALPRSGCLSTRRNGTPGDQAGRHQLAQVAGRLARAPRDSAPASGSRRAWPAPPAGRSGARRSTSQLLVPAAVPTPVPTASVSRSSRMANDVRGGRQPFQQPERDPEHHRGRDDPDGHPDQLAHPDVAAPGWPRRSAPPNRAWRARTAASRKVTVDQGTVGAEVPHWSVGGGRRRRRGVIRHGVDLADRVRLDLDGAGRGVVGGDEPDGGGRQRLARAHHVPVQHLDRRRAPRPCRAGRIP